VHVLWFNMKMDEGDPLLAFTIDWVNAFARYADRVTVVTMQAGAYRVRDNVRVLSLGKEKGFSEPRRALEFYRLVWRVLRRERVDAAFAHMVPLFAVMAAPLLKARGIPSVLWYAHGHVPPLLRVAHRLVDREMTSMPNAFRLPSDKLHVVGQGVDTEIFTPPAERRDDGEFTVVHVGRLSPIKDVRTLVAAADELVNRRGRRELRVELVGDVCVPADVACRAALEEMVRSAGLGEHVRFHGAAPFAGIPGWYGRADAAFNGCPTGAPDKAALEALACGVPLVASNETFRQVMGADGEGLVFRQGDANDLADRLERLAERAPVERAALGARLRQVVVRDHSLDRWARLLLGILREVTPGRGPAPSPEPSPH
jgi:glycosyltransferase involved in cell wall biosynthesis